jgi:hypothetical protein
VVTEGGRLDLGIEAGLASIYVYGGYDRLVGVDVLQNRRASAGAGLQVNLFDGAAGLVRAGPTLSLLAFDRNLRFFTYGQGGYFSPQRFIHGGLAVTWRREGTLRWEAVAEPGYDAFRENSSVAFPFAPTTDPVSDTLYLGRTSGGPSFNGRVQLGWAISDTVETGLSFAMQRAPEFQEMRAGIVLRFGGRR